MWTSGVGKKGGPWIWASTGLALDYENWAAGEPNDYGGRQNRLLMNYQPSGGWDDYEPSRRLSFVCEV